MLKQTPGGVIRRSRSKSQGRPNNRNKVQTFLAAPSREQTGVVARQNFSDKEMRVSNGVSKSNSNKVGGVLSHGCMRKTINSPQHSPCYCFDVLDHHRCGVQEKHRDNRIEDRRLPTDEWQKTVRIMNFEMKIPRPQSVP